VFLAPLQAGDQNLENITGVGIELNQEDVLFCIAAQRVGDWVFGVEERR
jgi:hypothetical protein